MIDKIDAPEAELNLVQVEHISVQSECLNLATWKTSIWKGKKGTYRVKLVQYE